MKTFKEVAHLYLGAEIRMFNAVTEKWSSYRTMSCGDLSLILNHDAKVEVTLKDLTEITEQEAYELAKIFDPLVTDKHFEEIGAIEYLKGGRYINSIWSISTAPSSAFAYLLSKRFDLFGLLESGEAVPF